MQKIILLKFKKLHLRFALNLSIYIREGAKKDNSDERRCKGNEKILQRAMRT